MHEGLIFLNSDHRCSNRLDAWDSLSEPQNLENDSSDYFPILPGMVQNRYHSRQVRDDLLHTVNTLGH